VATPEELAGLVAHATQDVPGLPSGTQEQQELLKKGWQQQQQQQQQQDSSAYPPHLAAILTPPILCAATSTPPDTSTAHGTTSNGSSMGSQRAGGGVEAGLESVWSMHVPSIEVVGLEWVCYSLQTLMLQGKATLASSTKTLLDAATLQSHLKKQQQLQGKQSGGAGSQQPRQQQQQQQQVYTFPRGLFSELAVVAYKQRTKESGAAVSHAQSTVRAVQRSRAVLKAAHARAWQRQQQQQQERQLQQPQLPQQCLEQAELLWGHQQEERLVLLHWRARTSSALLRACTQLLAQFGDACKQQALRAPAPLSTSAAAAAAAAPPSKLAHAVLRTQGILQRVSAPSSLLCNGCVPLLVCSATGECPF